MKIVTGKRFSDCSEGFKDGIIESIFDGTSLGSEDVISLRFLVGSSVGASVGSSERFKDSKFYGTLVGNFLEGEGRLSLVVE